MKQIKLILIIILIVISTVTAQNKDWGFGAVVGEPTGISTKYWTNETNALQGAVAWSFVDNGALRLQNDYLWHYAGIKLPSAKLPLYGGLGIGATFADDFVLKLRIPVGLDYQFTNIPFDVFVEIVPGISATPFVEFGIEAGMGVRYWLK